MPSKKPAPKRKEIIKVVQVGFGYKQYWVRNEIEERTIIRWAKSQGFRYITVDFVPSDTPSKLEPNPNWQRNTFWKKELARARARKHHSRTGKKLKPVPAHA